MARCEAAVASEQRLTLETKEVWSSTRLLSFLSGSHCNELTHTYSLKTFVYTQPRAAVALSLPAPGAGISGRCQWWGHSPDLRVLIGAGAAALWFPLPPPSGPGGPTPESRGGRIAF